MTNKNVYIIAGPNGAGKSTFARTFLPAYTGCTNFVNAYLIAQGLAPFEPQAAAIKAGRLVLEQINEYAERGVDFAFETTLSGKSYADTLRRLRKNGYVLHLFFLWIPSPVLAISRIKYRVENGGHHVPAADVRRRYSRSIKHFFNLYADIVDYWEFLDNSNASPIRLARKHNGRLEILDREMFFSILKGAE